jgi:hypothetical protein
MQEAEIFIGDHPEVRFNERDHVLDHVIFIISIKDRVEPHRPQIGRATAIRAYDNRPRAGDAGIAVMDPVISPGAVKTFVLVPTGPMQVIDDGIRNRIINIVILGKINVDHFDLIQDRAVEAGVEAHVILTDGAGSGQKKENQ